MIRAGYEPKNCFKRGCCGPSGACGKDRDDRKAAANRLVWS